MSVNNMQTKTTRLTLSSVADPDDFCPDPDPFNIKKMVLLQFRLFCFSHNFLFLTRIQNIFVIFLKVSIFQKIPAPVFI